MCRREGGREGKCGWVGGRESKKRGRESKKEGEKGREGGRTGRGGEYRGTKIYSLGHSSLAQ